MSPPPSRSAGLDTLRAAAIGLVFMYHYECFVSGQPTFGWASDIGWTGVDLFFVLSGYLISNQLFKGIVDGRSISVRRFYLRRALRTLPVFWLVLAAYWIVPLALGGTTAPPLWRFLTFTQNLDLQPGTTFSHAWSLCVEEQFYLVLPVVLWAGAFLARSRRTIPGIDRRHGWALMAVLVAAGMTARATLWLVVGRKAGGHVDDYMTAVYYATPCRFDEFIPGIAVAMLKNFHRPQWAWLMARGNALLAIGILATGAMWGVADHNWIKGYGYPFFMTTFGYSLLAMSFALLVAAALSPVTPLHRVRVPGAERIALWSYSVYLSHRAVANVLMNLLKPWSVADGVLAAIVAAASLVVGALLYELVESPFMALRDRWTLSRRSPQERPTRSSSRVATP